MPALSLNLVVIRATDLERARVFYEAIGLRFIPEKHGTGPEHFACDLNGVIIELYPRKSTGPVAADAVRLGFVVADLEDIVKRVASIGGQINQPLSQSDWGLRAVVCDPDGYRVELTERV